MKKILLSTDIGTDIDDAFCLLAMLEAKMNLDVVYVTNGDVHLRSLVAKHMIDLARSSQKVALGISNALDLLVKPFDYDVECNVSESFIDSKNSDLLGKLVYKKPSSVGIIEDGIGDMAKRLRYEKCVIFSIAPLTNIAVLIRHHPEVLSNIERLYVMGCRLFTEDTRLEHNIKYDPEAARIVFGSDIPITVVPGDVCSRYRMPTELLDQLISPAGKYVKRMALAYLALLTFSEIRMLRPNEHIGNALKLKGWYGEFSSLGDDISKNQLLKKIHHHQEVLKDDFCARYEASKYLGVLDEVIDHIESSKGYYRFADFVVDSLKHAKPKNFSVSDVYIPFCYMHPESIQVTRKTIEFDGSYAESYMTNGVKHEIVTDINADHFQSFLKKYLK